MNRHHNIAAVMVLAVVLSVPAASSDADDRIRSLAGAAGQEDPIMRIGLDAGPRLLVDARRSFRIVDPRTGDRVWRKSFGSEVAVVAEGAGSGMVATVFRIQVSAFSSEHAAEQERARLASRFGVPAVVHYVPDRGTWRVRLGLSDKRAGLSGLMDRLRSEGFQGLWIAEEPAKEVTGITLRLVDTSTYESFATGLDRVVLASVTNGTVRVEGTAYRGVIELRVTPYGTVRAINWVDLEHYLRGVVPRELGPEVWPQLEALKAQAVAARTYAWRHSGQFEEEGFDICATPRCQVYGGQSAEHPLSDRAVEDTAREILTWEGEPISAMYTATCGGHTEDAGEIFPEEKAPYLVGVPCSAGGDELGTEGVTLHGRKVLPVLSEVGQDVTRDRALLAVAGVIGSSFGRDALQKPLAAGDLAGWMAKLADLAGRSSQPAGTVAVATLGETAATLLRLAGWDGRPSALTLEEDPNVLLGDSASLGLPPGQRRALAYLAMKEMIRPFPDGRFGAGEPPTPARVIPALVEIGGTYAAFGLREAVISGSAGGFLRMFRGKRELRFKVADRPALFGYSGGVPVPREEIFLWPGDRVRYRLDPGRRIDFLEIVPPVKGVADDRSASVYSWEVRRSRKKLESAINARLDIGVLLDLVPLRRGVSGRIVELRVEGKKGKSTVRGFDIRKLLDLRDAPMVLEIQRDGSGQPTAVVFSGKGWGHGIGLCQVGAYGMALRGKSYIEILTHYYHGVELALID